MEPELTDELIAATTLRAEQAICPPGDPGVSNCLVHHPGVEDDRHQIPVTQG